MKTLNILGCFLLALSCNAVAETPTEQKLILLLDDETYGTDIADRAVLSVSSENLNRRSTLKYSGIPGLVTDLGSPRSVDYLIKENRLSNKVLATLPADDPERLLHQYVVATYAVPSDVTVIHNTVQLNNHEGSGLRNKLKSSRPSPVKNSERIQTYQYSSVPNDTHYRNYQRYSLNGIMQFEKAWDYTTGYAKLGMIDSGINENHPDFIKRNHISNYKKAYSFTIKSNGTLIYGVAEDPKGHGTHVAGVMVANSNNRTGITGVCQDCWLIVASTGGKHPVNIYQTEGIYQLVKSGVSVINMSYGKPAYSNVCKSRSSVCQAIKLAKKYQVAMVASAGNGDQGNVEGEENFRDDDRDFPDKLDFPSAHPDVIAVGAIGRTGRRMNLTHNFYSQMGGGSTKPVDVMAYGIDVFSTLHKDHVSDFYAGSKTCKDSANYIKNYDTCTGTSMSAPYITGLVGLMRTANPYLTNSEVLHHLKSKRGNYTTKSADGFTYKIPNAKNILRGLLDNNKNRKIPLISLYSSKDKNSFYTVSPQSAAIVSFSNQDDMVYTYTMQGKVANGFVLYGYQGKNGATPVQADVYVYATKHNPVNRSNACALKPLHRLAYWANGNADHTYTTEQSGINHYVGLGYRHEGIEGYIFPKNCSQPHGTVKLMRMYNSSKDDHALFPETKLVEMKRKGYTEKSGSDWLGYVYPL